MSEQSPSINHDSSVADPENLEKNKPRLLRALKLMCESADLGPDVSYNLFKAGEIALAEKVGLLNLKSAVNQVCEQLIIFLAAADKLSITGKLVSALTHEPVHMLVDAQRMGLNTHSCFKTLAELLSALYESNAPYGYGGMASVSSMLGDEDKAQAYRQLAIDHQSQSQTEEREVYTLEDTARVEYLVKAGEAFMAQIEGDPILEIDKDAALSDVKNQLKQKLGMGELSDDEVVAAIE